MSNKYFKILISLLTLFVIRVVLQLIQYFYDFDNLPSFNEFQSGTLPYGYLLLFQIIIIGIFASICIKIYNGSIKCNYTLGYFTQLFSIAYMLLMVLRYIIKMYLYPNERWIGGSIPIFFHIILAGFLLAFSLYHLNNSDNKNVTPSWVGRFFVFLIFTTFPIMFVYQLLPTFIANKIQYRNAQYYVEEQNGIQIPMDDGHVLYANVYHPKGLDNAPTILIRIPIDNNLKGKVMSNITGRIFAERGYNVIIQGTRGRFGSNAKFTPFLFERSDGISTINWINKQKWHNGKIGMWGGSYFGYTQWAISDIDSLGISSMMIQLCSSQQYDFFYKNNAFSFQSALYWATRSRGYEDFPLDEIALSKGYQATDVSQADSLTLKKIEFYQEWVRHKNRDSYWEMVDGNHDAKNSKVPTLIMAGWFDPYLELQINDFLNLHKNSSIVTNDKLIIGPWAHAETVNIFNGYLDLHYRLASIAPALNWFDYTLKGEKDVIPKIQYFKIGENKWYQSDEVPFNKGYDTLYFSSKNTFSKDIHLFSKLLKYNPSFPTPSIGNPVLNSNFEMKVQNEILKRDDILYFETPKTKMPYDINGNIIFKGLFTSSNDTLDLIVRCFIVDENGNAYNLTEGNIRKFDCKNKEQFLDIKLNTISVKIDKNQKIGILISGSSYPCYEKLKNKIEINFNQKIENPSMIIIPTE